MRGCIQQAGGIDHLAVQKNFARAKGKGMVNTLRLPLRSGVDGVGDRG